MRNRRQAISAPYAGPELIHRIRNAVFLAAIAMLCSLPVSYHHYRQLDRANDTPSAGLDLLIGLAQNQSLLVFTIALLSSLIGCLYAERLGLVGLRNHSRLPAWLGMGLLLGLLVMPISYYLFDKNLFLNTPLLYPQSWPWALLAMLSNAVSQEIVLRFGLLTIGIYFLHWWGYTESSWPALLPVSLFGTAGYYAVLVKFGIITQIAPTTLLFSLFSITALQWLYGVIYLRYGLLAIIAFHFGASIRFVVYAIALN